MILIYFGDKMNLMFEICRRIENGLCVINIGKYRFMANLNLIDKVGKRVINIYDEYPNFMNKCYASIDNIPFMDIISRDRYATYEDVFSWWFPRKYSKEHTICITKAIYHTWKYILKKFNVDKIIVLDDVADMVIHLLYIIAFRDNIPLAFLTPHILGGYMISITPLNESIITLMKYKSYSENDSPADQYVSHAEEFIRNLRTNPSPPEYMKGVRRKAPIVVRSRSLDEKPFPAALDLIFHGPKSGSYPFYNPFIEIPRTRIQRLINVLYLKRLKYIKSLSHLPREYYLYTLHFQPEAASIYRNWFWDQYDMLKTIVRYVPDGKYIVLKDHYAFHGITNRKLFKLAEKLPNVLISSPFANIYDLIKNSRGVVVYTNTTGFEAIILRKPVLSLGRTYYSYFKFTVRAENVEDIWRFFRSSLDIPDDYDEELLKFVAAYLSSRVDFNKFNLTARITERNLETLEYVNKFLSKIDFKRTVFKYVPDFCRVYPYMC